MRPIRPLHTLCFLLLLAVVLALALGSTVLLDYHLALGDFRGVALVLLLPLLVYLYALLVYRLFFWCLPLPRGTVAPHSREELVTNVSLLFYLLLFNSLIRTHAIPVPLLRLLYLALGARLGPNTYSAGVLLDPMLTQIGGNTLIGHDAIIFGHVIEGQTLALHEVHIGSGVTIGAGAIIMAGVEIGDGAMVSAGAVVTKDSHIGAGEIWGGMPARLLRKAGAGAVPAP